MNKKYERYINFIANDLQPPYYENMRDSYGLSEKEYPLVLSKVFNQPITIEGISTYNSNDKRIYHEDSSGYWEIFEYDTNGKVTYTEDVSGYWVKYVWNDNGDRIYYENSYGDIIDRR